MIIIILYDSGNGPSHHAGQVILIQKLSSASIMPDVAFLILVQVISCLSTDQHPYCRTLQSCRWQSHIIWKVPISTQETSCH